MSRSELIEVLRCTVCSHDELKLGAGRRPALGCDQCSASFPIIDGIVDMVAANDVAQPGNYRTDTVPELIGGMVDVAAPFMSTAVWHCSPLRYVDVTHRAVGRAEDGLYVAAPIGTGIVLDRVLAHYHRATVVGVDSSLKVLRKAARRFRDDPRVHLVRANLNNLPLRSGAAQSVQSLHGLHTVTDRERTITEFVRVSADDAFVSGTALVRGQELVADAVLDRYERWGLLPMLRTPEFIVTQLRACGLSDVRFETHGAMLFFTATTAAEL